jgi:hypothetical protein
MRTPSTEDISDGFHTFKELYEHRVALFLALMASNPDMSWFSRYHDDGKFPFDDPEWVIAGMNLPTGQITYHLPASCWNLLWDSGATCLYSAYPWDGHTPNDVVERLNLFVTVSQVLPSPHD